VYEGSFLLQPHQNLLLFVSLMIATLTGMKWNLRGILICISFMGKDVEYFFMYLLAICTFSSENCLLDTFAHLLIGSFVLFLFNFLGSLYILDINLLSTE
jgi:hypothetical protein